MGQKNFLLKVLGLSAGPRVITSVLSLVTFPIMVKTLGAKEYGLFVFAGSFINILDSVFDFGVASAAGKSIAAYRDKASGEMSLLIRKWLPLQFKVSLLGMIPALVLVWLISTFAEFDNRESLPIFLVCSSWFSVFLTFSRMSLTSLLKFKSLALLDTTESVLRNGGFILVSILFPYAEGLAIAQIGTAILSSIFGFGLLLPYIRVKHFDRNLNNHFDHLKTKQMLLESLSFLWLRVITKGYRSLPLIIFGKIVSVELLGLIGAFDKIVTMLTLPFNIIGNALSVKSKSILDKGKMNAEKMWHVATKVSSVSLLLFFYVFLGSESFILFFLPEGEGFSEVVRILSFLFIFLSLSNVITPMSDFIGGLKQRNIFMTFMVCIQCLLIYIGQIIFGDIGAVTLYVSVIGIMSIGYLFIARRSFFNETKNILSNDILLFTSFLAISAFCSWLISNYLLSNLDVFREITKEAVTLLVFSILSGLLIVRNQKVNKSYLNRSFLEFD